MTTRVEFLAVGVAMMAVVCVYEGQGSAVQAQEQAPVQAESDSHSVFIALPPDSHHVRLESKEMAEYADMLSSDDPAERVAAVKGISAMLPDMLSPQAALGYLEAASRDDDGVVAMQAAAALSKWQRRLPPRIPGPSVPQTPAAQELLAAAPLEAPLPDPHRLAVEQGEMAEYVAMLESSNPSEQLNGVKALSALLRDSVQPQVAISALRSLLDLKDVAAVVKSQVRAALADWEARQPPLVPEPSLPQIAEGEAVPLVSLAPPVVDTARRLETEAEELDEYTEMLGSDDPSERMSAVKALAAVLPEILNRGEAMRLLETATRDGDLAVSRQAEAAIMDWIARTGRPSGWTTW